MESHLVTNGYEVVKRSCLLSSLRCYSIFRVDNVEWAMSEGFCADLLHEIIVFLQEKGLQCTPPARGSGCIGTTVRISGTVVWIGVFVIQRSRGSTLTSWVWRYTSISYWKRRLKLVPDGSQYTGEALNEVCIPVREVLESEPWLKDIRRMTPAEHTKAVQEMNR